MSDKPKTSDGLPEEPDLADDGAGVEGTTDAQPQPDDIEREGMNPGPHQEQGGMRS